MFEKAPKSILKEIKLLHQKKYRKQFSLTIIEGLKLIQEAMEFHPQGIKYILGVQDFLDKWRIKKNNTKIYTISPSYLKNISLDRTPSGLIAVIDQINPLPIESFNKTGSIIVLDQISDPGNLGTIIRTAEAFAVSLIVSDYRTVDFSNPKVIRSSMGSYFRQNFIRFKNIINMIDFLKKNQYEIYSLDMNSDNNIFSYHFPEKTALIIGNESHGISQEFYQKSIALRIPMHGKNESLNAAVSCSIGLTVLEMQKIRNNA